MLSTLFSSRYAWSRPLLFATIVVVFFGFRGTVSHSILVGGWLGVWVLTPLFSSKAREDARAVYELAVTRFRAFQNGGPIPFRLALLFAGLPFALLALVNGRNISSFDNYTVQMTTSSLLLYGTNDFSKISGHRKDDGRVDCSLPVSYVVHCNDRGVWAGTPVGVLPLSLPVFAIGRLIGADLSHHLAPWRLAKWGAAGCLALCTALFFLIALKFGSLRAASLATLFVGAGSEWISTIGQGFWSHDPLTLGGLLSLFGTLVLFDRRPKLAALIVGIGWSWMFASRLTAATWIGPMGIWLLAWRFWFGVRAGIFAILTLIPWAIYYYLTYGHPLGPQMLAVSSTPGTVFSFSTFPTGFYGLLLSPGSGFFIYQPWALLLGILFFRSYVPKLPAYPGWTWAFAAMGLLQLALYSTFYQWSGQYCWGPRYLTEIVPLVGLAVVPALEALDRFSSGKRLYWTLGILAILIQMNGYLGPGRHWVDRPLEKGDDVFVRVLDWSDPAFLYPIPRWFR